MKLFRAKKHDNRPEPGAAKAPELEEKVYYLIADEDNSIAPAVYEQKATSLEDALIEVKKPYWLPRSEPREATELEVKESRKFMTRAQELYDAHDEIDSIELADFVVTLERIAARDGKDFNIEREVLIANLWDDGSDVVVEAKEMLEEESIPANSEQALGVAKLVCRMRGIDASKVETVLELLLTTDELTQGINNWIDPHYAVRDRLKERRRYLTDDR